MKRPTPSNRARSAVVLFDTTPYETSHLREPRGRGSWAFGLKRDPDVMTDEVIWAPASSTYGEAKRWAREEARRQGLDLLYVLP